MARASITTQLRIAFQVSRRRCWKVATVKCQGSVGVCAAIALTNKFSCLLFASCRRTAQAKGLSLKSRRLSMPCCLTAQAPRCSLGGSRRASALRHVVDRRRGRMRICGFRWAIRFRNTPTLPGLSLPPGSRAYAPHAVDRGLRPIEVVARPAGRRTGQEIPQVADLVGQLDELRRGRRASRP
jgi:hypothetical protein